MSLDVGSKKIGVALSDPLRITVRPLLTLPRRNLQSDARQIAELIQDHQVEKLVVGLPRHLEGEPSVTQQVIEPLLDHLRGLVAIPVAWAEERLSSKQAETLMAELGVPVRKRRERRDEFSAAIILQWYLDESDQS